MTQLEELLQEMVEVGLSEAEEMELAALVRGMIQENKLLSLHHSETVGLWATDKPNRLTAESKEHCHLFQIKRKC